MHSGRLLVKLVAVKVVSAKNGWRGSQEDLCPTYGKTWWIGGGGIINGWDWGCIYSRGAECLSKVNGMLNGPGHIHLNFG